MSKNTQILSNIFKLIVNLIKKIKNKRLLTKFIYICQQSETDRKYLSFMIKLNRWKNDKKRIKRIYRKYNI